MCECIGRLRYLGIYSGGLKEKREGFPRLDLEEREGDRDRLGGLSW